MSSWMVIGADCTAKLAASLLGRMAHAATLPAMLDEVRAAAAAPLAAARRAEPCLALYYACVACSLQPRAARAAARAPGALEAIAALACWRDRAPETRQLQAGGADLLTRLLCAEVERDTSLRAAAPHRGKGDGGAPRAARRAAILHATEASRKEKERLLAEAHEHAEKEMEAARIRAMEIIATAEAVGAQRVAAATNSVHSVFDEEHPHLSETHPVLDGSGSPVRSRSSATTCFAIFWICVLNRSRDLTASCAVRSASARRCCSVAISACRLASEDSRCAFLYPWNARSTAAARALASSTRSASDAARRSTSAARPFSISSWCSHSCCRRRTACCASDMRCAISRRSASRRTLRLSSAATRRRSRSCVASACAGCSNTPAGWRYRALAG